MNVFFAVGVVFVALMGACVLRQVSSPLTALLPIMAIGLVLVALLPRVGELLEGVSSLAEGAGIGSDALSPVFRGLGIVLITRVASGVCADNGQKALGETVEYCGQIFVVSLTLPLVLDLAQRILNTDF